MKRTLVAYGSKHGSTKEVATAIAADLRAAGHDVDLLSAGAAVVAGLDGYESVVIGGSLYLGRWHSDVCRFMRRHRTALGRVPLAVFALGPRTLDRADVASSRKQLDDALERVGVEPQLVTIFGGVLDPSKLHFPFNRMPQTDARDWRAIDACSEEVGSMIRDRETVLV